ncbi:MAG: type II toxin-antitoxin system VapC family toxin [Cyanophyceae cyanobacterium]
MRIDESLRNVKRLFLDSAPVIYHVEANSRYCSLTADILARIDRGLLTAVTSPITLAACLVIPYQQGRVKLQQTFTNLIVNSKNTELFPIDQTVASYAAEMRSRYNLSLLDTMQVAIALAGNCDALLTNDLAFRRITKLPILILEELEL